MKMIYKGTLTFVTPCFMTGAMQNEPEIRVSSIRGELRWWFRAVGGTLADETAVFGGVHGATSASAVVLRVLNQTIAKGPEIKFSPISDKGYLYYFAKVSGNNAGVHRTSAGSYAEAGSSFVLEVLERKSLEAPHRNMLMDALAHFLRYGALGLRATRGCGAFVTDNAPDCEPHASLIVGRVDEKDFSTGVGCQEHLGGFLRALRKDHHLSGTRETALGYSFGKSSRFASALRLRPVQMPNGRFAPFVVYTDQFCRDGSISELVKSKLISTT